MKTGALVISLDFELYWGIGDHINYDNYGTYFDNTLEAIPAILSLFSKHKIHCTWATVGMLWNESWEEWLKNIPKKCPEYVNQKLSNYLLKEKITFDNVYTKHFFALDLIKSIKATQGQEIGTHTYSHYYCNEESRNLEAFNKDLKRASQIALKTMTELESLVLPRNQFIEEILDTIKANNIKSVRTNPDIWYWHLVNQNKKTSRIARLVDSYSSLFMVKSYPWHHIELRREVLLQPASRFLRPIHKNIPFLNKLRINRIKKEMTYAAKNNEVYHLWWHPHNFAIDKENAIKELLDIIMHFQKLKKDFNFTSYNMKEIFKMYKDSTE